MIVLTILCDTRREMKVMFSYSLVCIYNSVIQNAYISINYIITSSGVTFIDTE